MWGGGDHPFQTLEEKKDVSHLHQKKNRKEGKRTEKRRRRRE